MVDGFKVFADAVRAQFKAMSAENLYVVDMDRDAIWDTYLAAFPEGSNPIFRVRTEHDCSCCRHFIRGVGHVVAIQNGALTSVWDPNGLPAHYQAVADAMSAYVKSLPIRDVFLTPFPSFGTEKNFDDKSETPLVWNHFSATVPKENVSAMAVEKMSEKRTTYQVLKRGMEEVTTEALQTVTDLIAENAIYRGSEHKVAVQSFFDLHKRYRLLDANVRDLWLWQHIGFPVARLRNTVIGTLLVDLSEGMDLEAAVKAYEKKVAPENYKRPTALISKKMVEEAVKALDEMGYTDAIQRRHARFSDVSVNSVLFVDNTVKGKMKDGVTDLLMAEVKPAKFDADKATKISVDDFMTKVLPKTTGLQVYVENRHAGNFASLTAPQIEGVPSMFKWDNNFAWSYDGNVADSTIKDKVKKAGGLVEGVDLRVSLAWHNYDDLDLHCYGPKEHLYFGNKNGVLDVDMNAGSGTSREPVENMRWRRMPPDGTYKFVVHQYNRRESVNIGFEAEIETPAGVVSVAYDKGMPRDAAITIAVVEVKKGVATVTAGKDVSSGFTPVDKWGIKTLQLTKVNSVVLSPNHWDDNAVGNKHWFFILDGCLNPEPVRGIYNEFLNAKLDKHRKVFEVLGDKTKCPSSPDQMSGLGFSSTKKETVTVLATGPGLNQAYTISF